MKFRLGELFCGPGGIGYAKYFLEKMLVNKVELCR